MGIFGAAHGLGSGGPPKVFWNKDYDAKIQVNDFTSNGLSRDSSCIVDVFKRPKFGNSSISMREVITTSIL